ncbi:HAD hydrolase family protein [Patescibacteria group bacterium]
MNINLNLVLDYDGVIAYKNNQIQRKAWKLLSEFINEIVGLKRRRLLLHINSLRGISFFYEEFTQHIKKSIRDRIEFYLSGCAGSFLYDLNKNAILFKNDGLSEEVIKYLVSSENVKKILDISGQNDSKYWSKYNQKVKKSIRRMIIQEPRLYWDIGFPGSNQIFKCALDISKKNKKLSNILIDEINNSDFSVRCHITGNVLEITNSLSDKGKIMKKMLKEKMYKEGRIVVIGDNPKGSDKEMFQAFPQKLHGYSFHSFSNNSIKGSYCNESKLLGNFESILQKVINF